MNGKPKVVVFGTGRMGLGIVRLLTRKAALELVGVYARRIERRGMDAGELAGIGPLGIAVEHDLPALLARTRPDVVVQATCSRVTEARTEILTSLDHGANVISIAEEMVFPECAAPSIAAEIDWRAVEKGVTVVGTGVNPGFVLDLLVIVLTGVCQRVDCIVATRVNDLSPYGPSVLTAQGVGLAPEVFEKGVAEGTVVGHYGFPESISLIARALGWKIDRIEQTRRPIVSTVRRITPHVTVEPGMTAGCLHSAVAYSGGLPVIELIHPQQVCPQVEEVATGDILEIRGEPHLTLIMSPEIPGGVATVALAVNMVPLVLDAPPGFTTMLDLPVPRAMME